MRLPERVRGIAGVVAEFFLAFGWCAFAIAALSLSAVGLVTLLEWPVKDFLRYYTPLLLGLFSIGVTLYLFQKNVRESRDRARNERDQGVRPVLIAEAVDRRSNDYFGAGRQFESKECCVTSSSLDRNIYMRIENAGLGVALNTEVFIKCWNGDFYLVAYEIPKIAVNEEVFIMIKSSLPSIVQAFVTRYRDIFENVHYCIHEVCDDYVGPEQMIVGNSYLKALDREDLGRIKIAEEHMPLTREIYMTFGYTAIPPEEVTGFSE